MEEPYTILKNGKKTEMRGMKVFYVTIYINKNVAGCD